MTLLAHPLAIFSTDGAWMKYADMAFANLMGLAITAEQHVAFAEEFGPGFCQQASEAAMEQGQSE